MDDLLEETVWHVFQVMITILFFVSSASIVAFCAICLLTFVARRGIDKARRQLANRTLSHVTSVPSKEEEDDEEQ